MMVDGVAFVYMGVCILVVMNKSGTLLLLHLMLRVFYVLVNDFPFMNTKTRPNLPIVIVAETLEI